jgi:hypothetical protein
VEKNFGQFIDSYSTLEFFIKKLVSRNYVISSLSTDNIKYYLHPFDGHSSERIFNEIKKELH